MNGSGILFLVLILMVIFAGYQRIRIIRLRTTLRAIARGEAQLVRVGAGSSNPQREMEILKQRLHVLERIATDKENTLARQIEELRDR